MTISIRVNAALGFQPVFPHPITAQPKRQPARPEKKPAKEPRKK